MTKEPNIIGCTGHRKLDHHEDEIKRVIKEKLYQYEADVVVTGMALGFDMLVAETCVKEKVPFIAAIPCHGQTKLWSQDQKQRYMNLMDEAWKYKIICPGEFAVWKLFERNKWIISRSNIIFAYWNGDYKGGTYSTWKKAKDQNLFLENLYPLCRDTQTT